MSAVLQFKRGLLANLPGLKPGEPGFTTDSYDLYVGFDETLANNQFVGSGRYWSANSATKGSGVNLVEGTNNGSNYLTLKSPDSLSGVTTYTFPASPTNGYFLKTNATGDLSWGEVVSTLSLAADNGSNDNFSTGETLTFAGTANEIETTVSDNQIQIGLPNDVTVGGGLTATTLTIAGVAVTAILDEDTFASNRADALATQQSIKAYVDANETHIDNLVSLSGVSKDTTNLGTFTGSTITDSRNIKEALQDLETSLESVSGGGASATSVAVARTDANSTHYLTFVDGNNATKTQEDIQTDAGVTYNPSTNLLTVGEISATTLDIGGTNVTSTAAELNVLSGVTAFVDEDNMASDSATSIPSQQSVKAYVDSQVSGVDVEFGTAGDSGTGTVNTSQSLTISGTSNEIVTSASGQGITIALPDDVTIGQDLTVTRNLIVNGSTTQVNVENMTVDDPLVAMGTTSGNAPGADFGRDLGILMHYYSSGAKLASVYWDNSESRMIMASVVTEADNVLTATTRATVEIGSLMLSDAAGTAESVITTSGSERILQNITVDAGSF